MNEGVSPWIERLTVADDMAILRVIEDIQDTFRVAGRDQVPGLIEMLDHAHPNVRWGAAAALTVIGEAAAAAVPRLLHAADTDPDAQVRHDAAQALKEIAAGDAEVIEGFFRLHEDRDDDVRGAASEGLHRALRVYNGPDADAVRERIRQWLRDY